MMTRTKKRRKTSKLNQQKNLHLSTMVLLRATLSATRIKKTKSSASNTPKSNLQTTSKVTRTVLMALQLLLEMRYSRGLIPTQAARYSTLS